MPIDASIPLQLRPMQLESPIQQAGNVLALQGGMQRNALAGMQMQQMQRQVADDDAMRAILRDPSIGGDPAKAANALRAQGLFRPAMEMEKAALETREKLSKISKDEAATTAQHLGTMSGIFGPLAASPEVSLDQVAGALNAAKAAGVPEGILKNIADHLPQNAMQIGPYIKNIVLGTENGRKALAALMPDLQTVDTGGNIQFINKNPLAAGGVGSAVMPSVSKTATPDAVLRDATQKSEGALNRGVQIRGQNMTDARAGLTYDSDRGMVIDTRTGTAKPVAAGGQPLGGKLSESAKKELQGIDAQNNTIAEALNSVKATPGAFGVARGLATMAGTLPETAANAMSDDASIQARSFVFNVVSKVINERAGAAQSAQELARLRSFLPAETDSAAVIESKLKGFQKYLAEQRKAYETMPTGPKADTKPKAISTDAEYEALPSGATFIAPDGTQRRKP